MLNEQLSWRPIKKFDQLV